MADSRSIHISTNELILFLSVAVCYFILCMYYIFCIHASVIGYVGCFYVLAVVKSEEQLLLFVPSHKGRSCYLGFTGASSWGRMLIFRGRDGGSGRGDVSMVASDSESSHVVPASCWLLGHGGGWAKCSGCCRSILTPSHLEEAHIATSSGLGET